jgi:predicted DNA-binding transcriptional regulator AlpA
MQNSAKPSEKIFDKSSFIYAPQMAEMMGCSLQAIYNRVNRKQIPHKKLFGRLVFVPKEIERWLAKKGLVTDVQR